MSFIRLYGLFLAWLVSIVAVGGSLYFSEILGYEPCSLCWYQRIFMYPQIILLGIMAYRDDKKMIGYVIPLNVIGLLIAAYHYGKQKIPALSEILPCRVGVPCEQDYINWLGFITIPFLALIAFILILVLLIVTNRQNTYSAKFPSAWEFNR